ncbi:hypothetical protein G6R29_05940 [Fructobacillus sp. M2-14]|uniref:Uncharacterized protein n=1 Tax=Fructobacillus broussonetiae TaxID=2713173 RepID=A0ABS5R144_9LACO|nr:hypothetical protein [Fructobacillus broussonetiae]MBS9339160.1 hypothetical protein [Fructobacillus broussonetiae]
MKKMLLIMAALCALFFVHTESVSANYSTDTDTSGKVTGVKGATYYNVYSWKDMFDAYKNSSESTVYLNVKSDIQGSADARKGQQVQEGKSVKILGNGNYLYFAASSDPTKGTAVYEGDNKTAGFYTRDDSVTNQTTLSIENAKWINSINFGIFEVSKNAAAKTIYKNVIEMNGSADKGATPIMNRAGAIEFYGDNVFNITRALSKNWGSGKVDAKNLGSTLTSPAGYANANWIQGGNDVTVYDGSTTVNSNAKYQKTIHHYDSANFDSRLTVKSKAKLYWNSDTIWFLEERRVKTKTWNIEDKAQFIINGTVNSMGNNKITNEHQWFGRDNELAPWNLNIGKGAVLDAQTGGTIYRGRTSTINPTNINVGENGTLSLRTLAASWSLFDGSLAGGSINLSKNSHMVLQANVTNKVPMFANSGGSIYLNGPGLGLTASSNFDGSDAYHEPAATGAIFVTMDGFPVKPAYSSATTSKLPTAKYIEFGTGTPIVTFGATMLDRLFKLDSSKLPMTTGLSSLIGGQDPMSFAVTSNKEDPNVAVQAKITNQKFGDAFKYSWKSNNGDVTALNSTPKTIWTMNDGYDYSEGGAGYNYTANFDQNHGLMMQTTNQLKNGTYDDATINYSLVDGPQTSN